MTEKGTYKLSYTLNKEENNLIIIVELKQVEGLIKPFQNVWYGIAKINGEPYKDKNNILPYCVDAKLCAEKIGLEEKEKIKTKAKKENVKFKIKKEELK